MSEFNWKVIGLKTLINVRPSIWKCAKHYKVSFKGVWIYQQPYKHTTCIPRWNDVETAASTSFQRGIHVVCLKGGILSCSQVVQVELITPCCCFKKFRLILFSKYYFLEGFFSPFLITLMIWYHEPQYSFRQCSDDYTSEWLYSYVVNSNFVVNIESVRCVFSSSSYLSRGLPQAFILCLLTFLQCICSEQCEGIIPHVCADDSFVLYQL